MPRAWVWLQLVIGWLPVWALYAALMLVMHPGAPPLVAGTVAARAIALAALLAFFVIRVARRFPWPHPFRLRFTLPHLIAGPLYATVWVLAVQLTESIVHGDPGLALGPGLFRLFVMGIWIYVMVSGVSYAVAATDRAARAEAAAARAQLDALRRQIHPHFLFNVLHSVVQLIPGRPDAAQRTAEGLADLLRTTLQRDREIVSLAEEWRFVSGYLELERLRFGDRLRVRTEFEPEALQALLPSFSLLTLVENAIRHGAAPKEGPTDVVISAARTNRGLVLEVADTGAGDRYGDADADGGTGLDRLRERLRWIYGDEAHVDVAVSEAGCRASLALPLNTGDAPWK